MMTLVLLLACVGYLLVAFPVPGSLYVASIIIGFSFGAQLTLLFAIISELFGLKYYSTLFNCGQLASPLGSYIFNVRLTGMLYDKEAMKDRSIPISIAKDTTIKDLKSHLQPLTNVLPRGQKLIFKGFFFPSLFRSFISLCKFVCSLLV